MLTGKIINVYFTFIAFYFFFGLNAPYFLENLVSVNFVNKLDTKTHSDIW